MSSPYDPKHAAAGDVGAALMMVDSRLRGVHDGITEALSNAEKD
ncbi:hypothetical protein P3L51_34505 [Streptomyces sp. PSRA5]